MELEVGNIITRKSDNTRYKIIDIFRCNKSPLKYYVLKDIWHKYSEPIIVWEKEIFENFKYKYIYYRRVN